MSRGWQQSQLPLKALHNGVAPDLEPAKERRTCLFRAMLPPFADQNPHSSTQLVKRGQVLPAVD